VNELSYKDIIMRTASPKKYHENMLVKQSLDKSLNRDKEYNIRVNETKKSKESNKSKESKACIKNLNKDKFKKRNLLSYVESLYKRYKDEKKLL